MRYEVGPRARPFIYPAFYPTRTEEIRKHIRRRQFTLVTGRLSLYQPFQQFLHNRPIVTIKSKKLKTASVLTGNC
jgi:hypothetical protein